MRLLRIVLRNAGLFHKPVEIFLNTSDGVRTTDLYSDHDMLAYKVKKAVYTQVMVGVIGSNATGKTTVLEIISLVLHVVFEHKPLEYPEAHRILSKLMPIGTELRWEVYFTANKNVYRLESEIERNRNTGLFEYKRERLNQKTLAETNGKSLYDFPENDSGWTRDNFSDNPLFKRNGTLVEAAIPGTYNGRIMSMESVVNYNLPYWRGRPDTRLINCFDPNIADIQIDGDEGSINGVKMSVFFKNKKTVYSGDSVVVGNFLSSGTIKGLSMLPAVMEVLKHGGYVIADELENHFNKKIVEWFLGLFSDKRTNPHGACLVFSTHYPELLDGFRRKDNIFVTRRGENNYLECLRFSDNVKRNDLSKSRIILSNLIKGTAPSMDDIERAKRCIIDYVSEEV